MGSKTTATIKPNQNSNNKNIATERYLLALPKITRTFLLRIDSQISVHICVVPSHSLFLLVCQRSTRREAVVSNKVRGYHSVYSRNAALVVSICPQIAVFSFSDPHVTPGKLCSINQKSTYMTAKIINLFKT